MEWMIIIALVHKFFDVVTAADVSSSVSNTNNSTNIIVIVSAIVVALLVGIILLCFYKRKKKSSKVADRSVITGRPKGQKLRNLPKDPSAETLIVNTTNLKKQKENVKQKEPFATPSTGATTPSQIAQVEVPPVTPLTAAVIPIGTQTDLSKVSHNLAPFEAGYRTGGSSGHIRGPRNPSEQRDTPPPQSRSSSDLSQRASLEVTQIRGSPSMRPTTQTTSRSSTPLPYGTQTPQYSSSGTRIDISSTMPTIQPQQQQQHSWGQDVYPEGSASVESALEQAGGSNIDITQYRDYDSQSFEQSFDPRLQTQSRSSDISLFAEISQHQHESYDDYEHYQEPEPVQGGVSPYHQFSYEPSPATTPPRSRASYVGPPVSDNPGSPSPPAPSPPMSSVRPQLQRQSYKRGGRHDRRGGGSGGGGNR